MQAKVSTFQIKSGKMDALYGTTRECSLQLDKLTRE